MVIAIIAVLAGLLLPALATVKELAKSTRCAAAQRQLGVAVAVYSEDWEGLLPSLRRDAPAPDNVTFWCELIAPNLGFEADGADGTFTKGWRILLVDSVLFGCSLRPRGTLSARSSFGWNPFPLKPESGGLATSSDWWTGGVAFGNTRRHIAFSRVGLRSSRLLLGDSNNWHLDAGAGPVYFSAPSGAGDPRRHRGRANYLMYDLRVASLDPAGALAAADDPATLP